jgi:hypothetical protein
MAWKDGRAATASWAKILPLWRQPGARPVLAKPEAYWLEIREQLLPQSATGQAVHYLLKNWTALTRYCDNPAVSIDNNHTERSLCGCAIGRNNWTFFGSGRGGKTAAVLRSFVASCELIEVHPFAWFQCARRSYSVSAACACEGTVRRLQCGAREKHF